MADIFDNSEEKKSQIAKIAETKQKAILCQGKPSGIYRYLPSGKQQISYSASVDAILFTSSKRVCLYEKKLDNGGKQWTLMGNGDYQLTTTKGLYKSNLGVVANSTTPGVPPQPNLKEWSWDLDWIKTNYSLGTNYNTIYNNIVK